MIESKECYYSHLRLICGGIPTFTVQCQHIYRANLISESTVRCIEMSILTILISYIFNWSNRSFKETPGTHEATFPWSLSSWTFKSSSLWKQWISQLKWLTLAPCLLFCSQMQIDSSTFYENHRLQSEVAKPASLASLQKAVSLDVNANQACNNHDERSNSPNTQIFTGLRAYTFAWLFGEARHFGRQQVSKRSVFWYSCPIHFHTSIFPRFWDHSHLTLPSRCLTERKINSCCKGDYAQIHHR